MFFDSVDVAMTHGKKCFKNRGGPSSIHSSPLLFNIARMLGAKLGAKCGKVGGRGGCLLS